MNGNYGKCDICEQPFTYGEDFVLLRIVRNWQSQGYPDQFNVRNMECHKFCFLQKALTIQEFVSKEEDNGEKI